MTKGGLLSLLIQEEEEPKEPQVEALVPAPEGLNLDGTVPIGELYAKAGLGDLSRSIFKAEELAKKLSMMTDADKKATIPGLLDTFGLTVSTLAQDADFRTNALEATLREFTGETTRVVETLEARIGQLTAEIDQAKTAVQTRRKLQEQQEDLIKAELERIAEIGKLLA